MQCIYSANYFDDRQGLRYYVRDLDIDSATALRDDIHHAGKELIQDKAYEQGIELLMIAAHCGDIEAQRAIVLYYAAGKPISCLSLTLDYWDEYWLFSIDLTGLEDELFLSAISTAYKCMSESPAAKRCVKIYEALANTGYQPALYELSLSLYGGLGVETNKALALAWAKVAAKLGFSKGRRLYQSLLDRIDGATKKESSRYYAEILENYMAAGIRLKTVDPIEKQSHET